MANTSEVKGNNFTPVLTLPSDMLARHKLKGGNIVGAQRYKAFRADKKVRDFSRLFHTYRTYVHGGVPSRNCAIVRSMAHYFCIPMSKMDSENPRDRRTSYGETNRGPEPAETVPVVAAS